MSQCSPIADEELPKNHLRLADLQSVENVKDNQINYQTG